MQACPLAWSRYCLYWSLDRLTLFEIILKSSVLTPTMLINQCSTLSFPFLPPSCRTLNANFNVIEPKLSSLSYIERFPAQDLSGSRAQPIKLELRASSFLELKLWSSAKESGFPAQAIDRSQALKFKELLSSSYKARALKLKLWSPRLSFPDQAINLKLSGLSYLSSSYRVQAIKFKLRNSSSMEINLSSSSYGTQVIE